MIEVIRISSDDPNVEYSGKSRTIRTLSKNLKTIGVKEIFIGPEGYFLSRFIMRALCFSIAQIKEPLGRVLRLYLYAPPFVRKNLRKTLSNIGVNNRDLIIHSHDFISLSILDDITKKTAIPKVLTVHSFGSVADEMAREDIINRGSLFHAHIKSHERKVLIAADAIIVPSKENSEALREEFPELNPEKFAVIHNPVETSPISSKIEREDIGLSDKNFVVVTTCHMKRVKRLDLFVEIARIASQKIPEARFIIIGDGPEKPKIKRLIRDYGLNEIIKITGFKTNAIDYMRLSDVIILTSFKESFGRSLAEGALLEKPLVAFNVGGIPEIIHDGRNGYMVPFGDIETFVEKLIMLSANKDLRMKMSKNSKKIAENFEAKKIARKHLELYERLIQERSSQVLS